jgi:hypothetical protein
MMKKYLYTVASVLVLVASAASQDKQAEFDKKFRFGLRVAAQPTWFTSNDNNNLPYGSFFGTGFGLSIEYRFSKIVALSTGIGGDFEGGRYTFRSEPSKNYQVWYWQNNAGDFLEPKNDGANTDLSNANTTAYVLQERTIKTTHVTIPAILKMSTNEYSGFKYFGMFGLELGIRIKTIANDKYITTYKFDQNGVVTNGANGDGPSSQDNINISKDASFVPFRAGFNAGIGTEYRLGGSTSAFFSVNYFRSFSNLMRSDSRYMIYNIDNSSGKNTYNFVKQNYLLNAIRINLGILF